MSDVDREELASLVRGWSAYLEWARDTGAAALSRTEGVALRVVTSEPVANSVARSAEATTTAIAQDPVISKADRAPAPPPPAAVEPPRAELTSVVRAAPVVRAEAPAATQTTPQRPALVRGDERVRALAVVEQEARECTRCKLCSGRTQAVFSRGNPEAELFFVGEAPGADEDRIGKPFVGAAGRLLDRILSAMGMTEDDVYIANVAKCRPPNNRPPEDDEAAACGPFLDRQLALVQPKVIVSWGRTPTRYLLQRNDSMSKLRGNWFAVNGVAVLPTWHPAYLLRNPDAKKDTWADMKRVLDKLGRALPATRG